MMRFAIAGGTVAIVYIGLGLLLSGPAGIPIQMAIPCAYLPSIALHFSLQRWFVFASGEFMLSMRTQVWRYIGVAFAQYLLTAGLTYLLPVVFGVSDRVAYVIAVLTAMVLTFLTLRLAVFHDE